jgi:hypothetical protein
MLRSLLLAAISATILVSSSNSVLAASPQVVGPDAGNWTVGNCILAQFAMEFQIHFNNSDHNQTMVSQNFQHVAKYRFVKLCYKAGILSGQVDKV